MPDISLILDGHEYKGWMTARVTRSLENLSGTFELGVSERDLSQDVLKRILPGGQCELFLEGTPVIKGYVDIIRPRFDGSGHDVAILGRDATADLVDCSAIHEPGEWHDHKLENIAGDLCAPFGISVHADVDTGNGFTRFRIEESETVFEALERLCRMRGVLCISDPAKPDRVLIVRAGSTHSGDRFEQGRNIVSASASYSHRDRFSEYIIKAQQPGSDLLGDEDAAHVLARAKDTGVRRYRPLVNVPGDAATAKAAEDRARWMASVNAGRGRKVNIVTPGWQNAEGQLWAVNMLAFVKARWLNIDHDMLITGVTFETGDSGTTTALTLMPPGAFELLAEPEAAPSEGYSWLS